MFSDNFSEEATLDSSSSNSTKLYESYSTNEQFLFVYGGINFFLFIYSNK